MHTVASGWIFIRIVILSFFQTKLIFTFVANFVLVILWIYSFILKRAPEILEASDHTKLHEYLESW